MSMVTWHIDIINSQRACARRLHCLSVCHILILEKAPFSGLKLTSVHSRRRFKSFKCSTFLKIEAILEKKRVELWP